MIYCHNMPPLDQDRPVLNDAKGVRAVRVASDHPRGSNEPASYGRREMAGMHLSSLPRWEDRLGSRLPTDVEHAAIKGLYSNEDGTTRSRARIAPSTTPTFKKTGNSVKMVLQMLIALYDGAYLAEIETQLPTSMTVRTDNLKPWFQHAEDDSPY